MDVKIDITVGEAWHSGTLGNPTSDQIVKFVSGCYKAGIAQGGQPHKGILISTTENANFRIENLSVGSVGNLV